MKKSFTTIFFSLFLFGCAASTPLTSEQKQAMVAPTCTGDQCTRMWQAAQVWIVKNSAFKIQLVNDTIIQTYSATNYTTDIAYVVTKMPLAAGGYSINMSANCDNLFGCQPETPSQAIMRFNTEIRKQNEALPVTPPQKLRLGIRYMDDAMAAKLPEATRSSLPKSGLLLVLIEPGSPAALAGLLVGDVLVGFGGSTITTQVDMVAVMAKVAQGALVDAVVMRSGQTLRLSVQM